MEKLFSIRMVVTDLERLRRIAYADKRTMSGYVRKLILEHIEKVENDKFEVWGK